MNDNTLTDDRSHDFLDVRLFHKKFGQPTDMPTNDGNGTQPPHLMPQDQFDFRSKFLNEEADEFAEACNDDNLVKAIDSLIDLNYVIFGTALFMRAGHDSLPMRWPTFHQVEAQAIHMGLRTDERLPPHLLTEPLGRLIGARLKHEIQAFCHCHTSVGSYQYALIHLWNAAWNAYFAASLMDAPWSECWKSVQDANMAKVRAMADGSNSTRQSGWDVVKPSGWTAPDLAIATAILMQGGTLPEKVYSAARAASIAKP